MTDLYGAIAANFDKQIEALRARAPFQLDPELEQLGAQLDVLRENSPHEFNSPGLARVRSQVTTYRRRKTESEIQS